MKGMLKLKKKNRLNKWKQVTMIVCAISIAFTGTACGKKTLHPDSETTTQSAAQEPGTTEPETTSQNQEPDREVHMDLSAYERLSGSSNMYYVTNVDTPDLDALSDHGNMTFSSICGLLDNRKVLAYVEFSPDIIDENAGNNASDTFMVTYDLSTGKWDVNNWIAGNRADCSNQYVYQVDNDRVLHVYDEELTGVATYNIDAEKGIYNIYGTDELFPMVGYSYIDDCYYRITEQDGILDYDRVDLEGKNQLMEGYCPDGDSIYIYLMREQSVQYELYGYDIVNDQVTKEEPFASERLCTWLYYYGDYDKEQYLIQQVFPLEGTKYYVVVFADNNSGDTVITIFDATKTIEDGNLPDTLSREQLLAGTDNTSVIFPERVTEAYEPLYRKADALAKQYGIQIYLGDQVPEELGGYCLYKCEDIEMMNQALDTLESLLSLYPENFFRQLPLQREKEFDIVLATNLLSAGDDGIPVASGFVTAEGSRHVMVLDMIDCYDWDFIFNHELFHMINERLEIKNVFYDNTVYSSEKWDALNPEGFAYDDTYADYVNDSFEDVDMRYFMRTYSITFATEDRADIFGYAMEKYLSGNEWTAWDTKSEDEITYVYAKLKYLCQCIRDGFDTTGWPEILPWETLLVNG